MVHILNGWKSTRGTACRIGSSAQEQVRARFRGLSTRGLIGAALKLRPSHYAAEVHVFTAMTTLKTIARRVRVLEDEAAEHEKAIKVTVCSWRPDLLAVTGVGPIIAATVPPCPLAAWSHAGRCRDDAAFAMLASTRAHSGFVGQDSASSAQPLQ